MVLSDSIFRMIAESGLVAKMVLLVLFGFSVVSWAIVGQKFLDLKRTHRQSARFLELFHSGAETPLIYKHCKGMKASPLCGLFCSGYELLSVQARKPSGWTGEREDLWKMLDSMITEQVGKLSKHLSFLATVANVSPFVGLLGTVWGIMAAFHNIGQRGSANLAVVAPGIAEALIATAAGLAAAIPAVIAYNFFLSRIDSIQHEVERFSAELVVVLWSNAKP